MIGDDEQFTHYIPNCPIPNAKVGTLVGKISTSEPFIIGDIKTFIAADSGMFYLRVNDGEKEGLTGLQDNSGVLAVELTVNP